MYGSSHGLCRVEYYGVSYDMYHELLYGRGGAILSPFLLAAQSHQAKGALLICIIELFSYFSVSTVPPTMPPTFAALRQKSNMGVQF